MSTFTVGKCYSVSRTKPTWGIPSKNFEFQDKYLGEYVKYERVGRPYDPDVVYYFKNEKGEEVTHAHQLGRDTYEETECKKSGGGKRKRTQKKGRSRSRRHKSRRT